MIDSTVRNVELFGLVDVSQKCFFIYG